jgi:two-component system, chemotaxis family, chemotaxis protein CheY
LGPRVFVVEDDQNVIELYKEILRIYGYELVGFVLNGKEAIEVFEAMDPRPDVIIMDQRLPLMSGIEATKEIMRIDPDAKVLFVSADINSRENALSSGAADFVVKPFGVKDFMKRLEVLSGRSAQM